MQRVEGCNEFPQAVAHLFQGEGLVESDDPPSACRIEKSEVRVDVTPVECAGCCLDHVNGSEGDSFIVVLLGYATLGHMFILLNNRPPLQWRLPPKCRLEILATTRSAGRTEARPWIHYFIAELRSREASFDEWRSRLTINLDDQLGFTGRTLKDVME